jgi:UTP--glucose-1-phosphate uridylyltransferase/phosphoglucomutase
MFNIRVFHLHLQQEPYIELVQNKSPKVDAATMAPAKHPQSPDMEW